MTFTLVLDLAMMLADPLLFDCTHVNSMEDIQDTKYVFDKMTETEIRFF